MVLCIFQVNPVRYYFIFSYLVHEFVTYTPPPSFMNSLQAGGKCKITMISDLLFA